MKPTKFAVAVVLHNPENEKEILIVLRPPDDENLPNVWGLPATTAAEGEMPEDLVRRIGKEKLTTTIEPTQRVGIKSQDKGTYELVLMDVEARLVGGEPSVVDALTAGTKYVEQKWVTDYSVLIPGAKEGSVCDRIFLESQGIGWE